MNINGKDVYKRQGLGLGVFGAALATLIAQGISAVFSFLIFLYRIRQYKSPARWFDGRELHSMLRIAVPLSLIHIFLGWGRMMVKNSKT